MTPILLFIIIFVILLCFISYLNKNETVLVNTNDYPTILVINNNKQLLIDESLILTNINIWTIYHPDILNYDILQDMNIADINYYLANNSSRLNIGISNLKLLWIKLNDIVIDSNLRYYQRSWRLLSQIDNTLNIYIMIIEPGYNDSIEYNNIHGIIKCFIPFFIPQGDNGIKVNDININVQLPSMFRLFHNIYYWNNTNTNMFVLVIDILE